jgi:hypothetical protein
VRGRHVRWTRGVVVAALLAGCTHGPRAVPSTGGGAAPSSPHEWSLAEQLRIGFFDYERLSDSIPGFAGLSHATCEMSVYLTHPERDGERARAVLRPALERGGGCVANLRVEASRSTLREMGELQTRIASLLREPQLWPRGGIGVDRDRIVIQAQNDRVLAAIRQKLAADPALPADRISVTLLPGPQELDGPIHPPTGAYLAVLDSVAARIRTRLGAQRVFVDTANLPSSVTAAELRARGFERIGDRYRCLADPRVSLLEPRQFADGRYRITSVEHLIPSISSMSSDYEYDVGCDGGACRVVRASPGLGDRIHACPS